MGAIAILVLSVILGIELWDNRRLRKGLEITEAGNQILTDNATILFQRLSTLEEENSFLLKQKQLTQTETKTHTQRSYTSAQLRRMTEMVNAETEKLDG
jgi:hypothetical protein